ncbi:hypothetical protein F4678DRAFT_401912 [Xylaria arbuscula]|nr:hypothetical protein F4678DRAFT_401912 [Xylaria arbuscula]
MEDDGYLPPRLRIDPPLFNSANPWATTLEHLRALYRCPSTGAVTTRTALLDQGFPHDDSVHRFAFFAAGTHSVVAGGGEGAADASLNTLGYSPLPLDTYLGFIRQIYEEEERRGDEDIAGREKGGRDGDENNLERRKKKKPFIVSVTGTPDEVAECYRRISLFALGVDIQVAMEVNLSCPNIPGKPPPAYEAEALRVYIKSIADVVAENAKVRVRVPWGLKTPPYTHAGQFEMFVRTLRECAVPRGEDSARVAPCCPLSFVTATNTLGSCLLLDGDGDGDGALGVGMGIGGLAGAPLHPLALGNVASLRRLLDAAPETRHVDVLGIGGVADAAGFRRMRGVGAIAVGVGTALGIKGVGVFGEIEVGLGVVW